MLEGSNGLDCEQSGCLDTVEYHGAPHFDPVFEVVNVCCNLFVEVRCGIGCGIGKEYVAIGMQDTVALTMKVVQFYCKLAPLYAPSGFRVFSVDGLVPQVPHGEIFAPYRGNDRRGP